MEREYSIELYSFSVSRIYKNATAVNLVVLLMNMYTFILGFAQLQVLGFHWLIEARNVPIILSMHMIG